MDTGGYAENGDEVDVQIIIWNGIIKGLVEGLEIEIELNMLRVGALRWWHQRLRIIFGVWLGRRLTSCRELKGARWYFVCCKKYSKYNWRQGEQDKFKCQIKAVSRSPDDEADQHAL